MSQIQRRLEKLVQKKSIPNIIFYGPYNCGKERACDIFVNNIYKDDTNINKYVLVINCLSTNGIKIIKEHIKLFSMQIFNKTESVKFKIIILKYSENLTYDSQYSLRRTIEQYSKTTRFVLICENKNQLLTPICSRFAHIYVNDNNKTKIYKNIDNFKYMKYNKIIQKYHNNLNLKNICDISLELYKNNFYSYEILNKFKNNVNYDNVKLLFNNLNKNFKNEVLSIFFLLVIFRNNVEIEIFHYY